MAIGTNTRRPSFGQCLGEPCHPPPINQPNEVRMSKTLDAYSNDMARYGRITPEEEKSADVETLVTANLRLVRKIAVGYEGRGVGVEELISAGNFGLLRAAQKFDATRNIRFSTYAAWWIVQSIMREIEKQGVVRFPNNVIGDARRLAKNDYNRDGLTFTDNAYKYAQRAFLPNESLSEPIKVGNYEAPRVNMIIDDQSPSPSDNFEEMRRNEFVAYCLEKLPEREADVLRRYFGLDGHEVQTMDQIGAVWGISRERTRQLLTLAKRKLAHLKREGREWLTV